jgi:putative transposase
MATNRNLIFANDEIYHVYNRGVEKRKVFTSIREYRRAIELLTYYRFVDPPLRYSEFESLEPFTRESMWQTIAKTHSHEVEIIAYCLMPNHFHFILKQVSDRGISKFIANFTNSYTKYFNTKYKRVGSLFQGPFKAVYVESEDQLLHLTRYVHLNPVTSFLLKLADLSTYEWSSFNEYIGKQNRAVCDTSWIHEHFKSSIQYQKFVFDQAGFAQELERIKHLSIDDE